MVEFSKDHHFALLLIWKIRQGIRKSIEPDRISRYIVHFFDHELNMHFEEEENLLFIHLPDSNSLRARAEKEHISIRQEIKQLRIKGIDHDQLEKLAEKQLAEYLVEAGRADMKDLDEQAAVIFSRQEALR